MVTARNPANNADDTADAGRAAGEGGGTEAQAKDVCLRMLTARARSRAELDEQLAKRGFTAAVRARTLDRLATARLVDDAEFARQWVRSRHLHSGKGRTAIAVELRNKGITADHATAALADLTRDDERDKAAEVVRRKLRGVDADEIAGDRTVRDRLARRMVGMLARRGYPQGLAFDVVKEVLAEARADVEDLFD